MWANAQRDGRPAEYRWRPLLNTAVWLTPTTRVPCSNAANARNPLKFAWVPQTGKPISSLVGRSSPYCEDMWRRYCCLTFFPIVDTCLICEDIARQSCAMVPRWQMFAVFCVLCFQRAALSRFQTCVLNSHCGHIMCGSMADIQSATAEIRRGKKETKNKRQGKNIIVCPIP